MLARRLRIFAFVKEYMEAHHDSPSREEIMAGLDLPDSMENALTRDLRRLRRADGLPMEIEKQVNRREHELSRSHGVDAVDRAFAFADSANAGVRARAADLNVET